MTLSITDFTANSCSADTRDVVQPIVKAMQTAAQDDSEIERVVLEYLNTKMLPADAVMDALDAALIRSVIEQNRRAIERSEYISGKPTEWEARGSLTGE